MTRCATGASSTKARCASHLPASMISSMRSGQRGLFERRHEDLGRLTGLRGCRRGAMSALGCGERLRLAVDTELRHHRDGAAPYVRDAGNYGDGGGTMITRRLFCGCLAGGIPFAATAVHAQSLECAVFTPDRLKSTAPDDAIAQLKAGNERFTAGKSVNCDLMAQVKQTASNQSPYAAIVGCIDSRVPPELVFDQSIVDVFCARVAGNIVNTVTVRSLSSTTSVGIA